MFKKEYEALNGLPTPDGEDVYLSLDLPEESPVTYAKDGDIHALFEGGDGILYMGFPECPWCRALVPVLLDAAAHSNYTGNFYYYNLFPARDQKHLDENGNIVIEREGTPLYAYLLKKLDGFLGPYTALNDPSLKRIYAPTTVFVSKGNVKSVHIGTLDAQEDPFVPMTNALHGELLESLKTQIAEIA